MRSFVALFILESVQTRKVREGNWCFNMQMAAFIPSDRTARFLIVEAVRSTQQPDSSGWGLPVFPLLSSGSQICDNLINLPYSAASPGTGQKDPDIQGVTSLPEHVRLLHKSHSTAISPPGDLIVGF